MPSASTNHRPREHQVPTSSCIKLFEGDIYQFQIGAILRIVHFRRTRCGHHEYAIRSVSLSSYAAKHQRINKAVWLRWALRNCGLMLFRALVDRIFGTNDSRGTVAHADPQRSSRISYADYPNLSESVMRLLCIDGERESSSPVTIELVFPALDIILRASPPQHLQNLIRKAVFDHLGSKVWHVRDLASRAYTSLVSAAEACGEIRSLLQYPGKDQNFVHGALLSIKNLMGRAFSSREHHVMGESNKLWPFQSH